MNWNKILRSLIKWNSQFNDYSEIKTRINWKKKHIKETTIFSFFKFLLII